MHGGTPVTDAIRAPCPQVSAPEADAVQARLAAINGAAQVLRARQADVAADYVLGIGGFDLGRIGDEVRVGPPRPPACPHVAPCRARPPLSSSPLRTCAV